jgi:nucleotide-binding universal stress UspA family protein
VIGMHRILCPVDLTPFSRRALEHAAVLARWYEAELHALFVVPLLPTVLGFPAGTLPHGVDTNVGGALCAELTRFAKAAAGWVAVQPALRTGEPTAEILQYAGELEPDLLVIGTHGRTGFDRLMLGSVAEKVLHKAGCPVLTVPRRAPEHAELPLFRTIVCGVDFSDVSQRAVAHALSLSQEAGGRLMLLHVVEQPPSETFAAFPQLDPARYGEQVAASARTRLELMVPDDARNWCRPEPRLGCGKPYREILRVAEQEQADLIVMGVHGHGAVDRLVFGSTTERVVRRAPCPLLTIR